MTNKNLWQTAPEIMPGRFANRRISISIVATFPLTVIA